MKKFAKAGAYVGFAYAMLRYDDIVEASTNRFVSCLARILPAPHGEYTVQ